MCERLQAKLQHVFAPLRKRGGITSAEVHRMLRGLRHALALLEVSEDDIAAIVVHIIDRVTEDRALQRADAAQRIESAVRCCLMEHAATRRLMEEGLRGMTLRRRDCGARQWDVAGVSLRNPHGVAFAQFMRPPAEGRARMARGRRPFRLLKEWHISDLRDRSIDRETLQRHLRALGKGRPDFGPEPPMGGSTARL